MPPPPEPAVQPAQISGADVIEEFASFPTVMWDCVSLPLFKSKALLGWMLSGIVWLQSTQHNGAVAFLGCYC